MQFAIQYKSELICFLSAVLLTTVYQANNEPTLPVVWAFVYSITLLLVAGGSIYIYHKLTGINLADLRSEEAEHREENDELRKANQALSQQNYRLQTDNNGLLSVIHEHEERIRELEQEANHLNVELKRCQSTGS